MTAADRSAMWSFSTGREPTIMHRAAINAAGVRHEKGGVTHDCQVWEERAMRRGALELLLVRVAGPTHH